jgi:hypothetical protein
MVRNPMGFCLGFLDPHHPQSNPTAPAPEGGGHWGRLSGRGWGCPSGARPVLPGKGPSGEGRDNAQYWRRSGAPEASHWVRSYQTSGSDATQTRPRHAGRDWPWIHSVRR